MLTVGRFALHWLGWKGRGFWFRWFRWSWMPDIQLATIGMGLIAFYAGEPTNSLERQREWRSRRRRAMND